MPYTDHQLAVFKDRYALRSLSGDVVEETPEQMWRRVSQAVAKGDRDASWAAKYYHLLDDFKFVPAGRILSGMGGADAVTTMNCYVIPSPEDSVEGILGKSLLDWARIQKAGGGVGINLSTLRPSGAIVRSVNGVSSGPVNWAEPFSHITHKVIQQGGSRRGAAMIMLNDDHPDLEAFIDAKRAPGVLEGCNISVCISNGFMDAVINDLPWDLVWQDEVVRTVRAKEIWDKIIHAAWASAEPGIYFMERANDMANSAYFEDLVSTNPCGEQPLGPYGACLLGAFDISKYINADELFNRNAFCSDVHTAVRFMDNVVDLSSYPLPECEDSQKRIRRMGLGLMGLADALIALRLRYGSPEAVAFVEDVYEALKIAAYTGSVELAKERGAFPEYVREEYLQRPFIKALPYWLQVDIASHGIRNCYLLTQAPTGTTSLLADASSGIEPYFDFRTLLNNRMGKTLLLTKHAAAYYLDGGAGAVDPDHPDYYITANEVSAVEHVLMQAAAQKHIDSSISKTANMPHSATVEDVHDLYMLAWTEGLKSLSVYRDGSRSEQALYHVDAKSDEPSTIDVEPIAPQEFSGPPDAVRVRLPDERPGLVHKFRIGDQEGYITVGLYEDGSPGEVFLTMSKEGSSTAGWANGLVTILSQGLQYGVPLGAICEKFIGTRFEPAGMTSNKEIRTATSPLDYLGRWLLLRFREKRPVTLSLEQYKVEIEVPMTAENISTLQDKFGMTFSSGEFCPDCSNEMVVTEGCMKCMNPLCGFSRC